MDWSLLLSVKFKSINRNQSLSIKAKPWDSLFKYLNRDENGFFIGGILRYSLYSSSAQTLKFADVKF